MSQTRPFLKPATTYAEQVAQLQRRGMSIPDPERARFYLQHLNYYRLAAYWLPFEADHATHTFDRELRLLVLDAIERIEVSVRSQWAYQLAHRHGPHAHLDPALGRRRAFWQSNLRQLQDEIERSDEAFVKHLRAKYAEALPPVWASCEVMSLGLLSRWYDNLGPKGTRRAIASVYGLDEALLASWLLHLTLLRNTCAHHSRLWNREFKIPPAKPRSRPTSLVTEWVAGSHKLYNSLLILLYLLDTLSPAHDWRHRLRALLERPGIALEAMGFPPGWEERGIWRGRSSSGAAGAKASAGEESA